jgi:hypothetical protein
MSPNNDSKIVSEDGVSRKQIVFQSYEIPSHEVSLKDGELTGKNKVMKVFIKDTSIHIPRVNVASSQNLSTR